MFSRLYRFHGHGSLRTVYQKGRAVYSQRVKLLYLPSNKLRVAVVVSKKVHKSAVVRNRIRRRLYEIIQQYCKDTALKGIDIVCVVQTDTLATSPAVEVQAEITGLLQKIKNIS